MTWEARIAGMLLESRIEELVSELIDRYGQPRTIDTISVIRVLGLRDQIHPRDAVAIRYPSTAAAKAFAAANRQNHDIDVFGPFLTEVGPVNVLDLRRSLVRLGHQPTDPSLPDDWKPPCSGAGKATMSG